MFVKRKRGGEINCGLINCRELIVFVKLKKNIIKRKVKLKNIDIR